MNREKFLYSRKIDKDEILNTQELLLSRPIDYFDIDGFESELLHLRDQQSVDAVMDVGKIEGVIKSRIEGKYKFLIECLNRVGLETKKYFYSCAYKSDSAFVEEIKRSAKSDSDGNEDLEDIFFELSLLESISNNTMPVEVFIGILKDYKEMLVYLNTELQAQSENIKRAFVDRFISKINPLLTDPKSESELADLLRDTVIIIQDPFSTSNLGSHQSGSMLVRINADAIFGSKNTGDAMHVATHEFLHAITSGAVFERISFRHVSTTVTSQRSGLQIRGVENQRFMWLNEAVTESLTQLCTEENHSIFEEYIKLMNLLLNKGKKKIGLNVLADAYFDSRYGDEKGFWRFMLSQIRESYDHDPQFLVKLDIAVTEGGIFGAVDFMENWDTENPKDIVLEDIRDADDRIKREKIDEILGGYKDSN
jgi:hypothetical protein